MEEGDDGMDRLRGEKARGGRKGSNHACRGQTNVQTSLHPTAKVWNYTKTKQNKTSCDDYSNNYE